MTFPVGARLEAFTAAPGVKAPVADIPPPRGLGYEGAAPNTIVGGLATSKCDPVAGSATRPISPNDCPCELSFASLHLCLAFQTNDLAGALDVVDVPLHTSLVLLE